MNNSIMDMDDRLGAPVPCYLLLPLLCLLGRRRWCLSANTPHAVRACVYAHVGMV